MSRAEIMVSGSGVVLKEIPSSPNADYRAGSDGQVYSRTKYCGFGRKELVDWYPLKGHTGSKGYQVVSMCHNNRKTTRHVHRLICEAFHGVPPKASMQTRHLDGNPKNNTPNNLAWGTQEDNWMDRKSHGRGTEGEKHPMSKLTDAERDHIRWCVSKGIASQRRIARVIGMSQAAIYGVCRGK